MEPILDPAKFPGSAPIFDPMFGGSSVFLSSFVHTAQTLLSLSPHRLPLSNETAAAGKQKREREEGRVEVKERVKKEKEELGWAGCFVGTFCWGPSLAPLLLPELTVC
ncbi:hypothetical protein WMY93_032574 [Mugilogobius chulae]|uniref:Uncharacterized protein n=1 Tax=Mugilogobius chulae TaxID=88201 RepID=A0AAW0MQH7_9GOBI